MKVIGAGLPRTGTLTQKEALERVGLGPCYHWVNIIADLDEVELWHRVLDGEDLLGEIFAG
ncbi:MAG TPA: sulfotransferase, partial [Solirubrobacteraceae bacterium]